MTGVILAGGQSRRMGQDKALLHIGRRTIIERVVEVLSRVCDPLLVVTNSPSSYAFLGLEMLGDLLPGRGALGGIYSALFFSPTPRAFVVACDMPLLNPDLISHLLAQPSRWDVVVPRVGEWLEPLHAVYSRRCLPRVEELLLAGGRKITDFYSRVRVLEVPEEDLRRVDPELRSLMNVNTREDLARLEDSGLESSPISSG